MRIRNLLMVLLILESIHLTNISCVEVLEPCEETYDQLTKQNNYTISYRILKKKLSEQTIMVSLDSLGFNYLVQAKYIYDNEEVNAKQEYVFSSHANHLFLTENFQRSPATNKTLIQLYQQSSLIGYEIKLSVVEKNANDASKDNGQYEFQISYLREEDIDELEDGTQTKFMNMFSGDMEWKKINFKSSLMDMMIFTFENAFEIEMFMYTQSIGNITLAKNSSTAPRALSKFLLKNQQADQMIIILIRRTYNMNVVNQPSNIDFNLSIISIFSKASSLSIIRSQFQNFDMILPIFNVQKIQASTMKIDLKNKQFTTTVDPNNNNVKTGQNVQFLREINNVETQDIEQSKLSSTTTTAMNDLISNVVQYELLIQITDYNKSYYLGATSTSCNSLLKYRVEQIGENYTNNEQLQLNENESNAFSDKYQNIDMTGTQKVFINSSEFSHCQPNCQIHAILFIEILVDPIEDFETFKLQGTQQIHDLSNPSKPFFDYLPLLSYTFFKVDVPEDLNQLTIQYFSGYKLCYLLFSHSYIPPLSVQNNSTNTEIINPNDPNYEVNNPTEISINPIDSQIQTLRQLQTTDDNIRKPSCVKQNNNDERPILKNLSLDTFYPNYQSGQMIVKPAKKGVHIFSALNISPVYSPFTIQVNSFNLRRMTNSSYMQITLNGINDVQSVYYDKTFNKDKYILLQFCSSLNDVTLYASTCAINQNITSCHSPSSSYNSYNQTITNSVNATIPDLCPNSICHILFTIAYTPFNQFKNAEESNENSVKKFSVTLIESKDISTNSSSGNDPTNPNPTGKNASDQQSSSKWIIIACCILLVGIFIVSALMCYIKVKQNKLQKQLKRNRTKGTNNDDDDDEEDDEEDNEDDQEQNDLERARRTNYSRSDYLMQERTTNNSISQNLHQELIDE